MIEPRLDNSTTQALPAHDLGEAERATVKEKWEGAVTAGSGFVAVPMALLRLQSKYELSPTDMMVLINLMAHWWEPKQVVYPRSTTIAARMGVDKRTVQRSLHKLQKLRLVDREILPDGKRAINFAPLVARLTRDLPAAYVAHSRETHGDF